MKRGIALLLCLPLALCLIAAAGAEAARSTSPLPEGTLLSGERSEAEGVTISGLAVLKGHEAYSYEYSPASGSGTFSRRWSYEALEPELYPPAAVDYVFPRLECSETWFAGEEPELSAFPDWAGEIYESLSGRLSENLRKAELNMQFSYFTDSIPLCFDLSGEAVPWDDGGLLGGVSGGERFTAPSEGITLSARLYAASTATTFTLEANDGPLIGGISACGGEKLYFALDFGESAGVYSIPLDSLERIEDAELLYPLAGDGSAAALEYAPDGRLCLFSVEDGELCLTVIGEDGGAVRSALAAVDADGFSADGSGSAECLVWLLSYGRIYAARLTPEGFTALPPVDLNALPRPETGEDGSYRLRYDVRCAAAGDRLYVLDSGELTQMDAGTRVYNYRRDTARLTVFENGEPVCCELLILPQSIAYYAGQQSYVTLDMDVKTPPASAGGGGGV